MKKYLFLVVLVILFFPVSSAFAQSIQTGSANVQNSVTNTASGSNCKTHIVSTVNGQTQTLDSSDCGTHTLNNSVQGGTTTEGLSSQPTNVRPPHIVGPTVSISVSPISTPTPKIIEKSKLHTPSFVSYFLDRISNFLIRIFHNL